MGAGFETGWFCWCCRKSPSILANGWYWLFQLANQLEPLKKEESAGAKYKNKIKWNVQRTTRKNAVVEYRYSVKTRKNAIVGKTRKNAIVEE